MSDDRFRDAAARRTDPSTSHAAASAVDATRLETIVMKQLKHHGGMTTHELADSTGLDLVSISPRMRPLVRKNLVRDSGKKRGGSNHRASIVWEVVVMQRDPPEQAKLF